MAAGHGTGCVAPAYDALVGPPAYEPRWDAVDASAAKEARGLPAADRAGLMGRPSRLRGEAGLISPSMLQRKSQRYECSVAPPWLLHINARAHYWAATPGVPAEPRSTAAWAHPADMAINA